MGSPLPFGKQAWYAGFSNEGRNTMKLQAITAENNNTQDVIGTVTFTEKTEPITEHHTAYAADHRTYTIIPGTYDVHLFKGDIFIAVDIEVTNETYHDGFAGVNHKTHINDTAHKTTKTYQFYNYEAAEQAGQPEPSLAGGSFRLNPSWIVTTEHVTLYSGEHYTKQRFAKIV